MDPRTRRRRPSAALVLSVVAVVLALGGTAFATGHYLITSTHQIAPRVLKQLRGLRGPRGPRGLMGLKGDAGSPGHNGLPGPGVTSMKLGLNPPAAQGQAATATFTLHELQFTLKCKNLGGFGGTGMEVDVTSSVDGEVEGTYSYDLGNGSGSISYHQIGDQLSAGTPVDIFDTSSNTNPTFAFTGQLTYGNTSPGRAIGVAFYAFDNQTACQLLGSLTSAPA